MISLRAVGLLLTAFFTFSFGFGLLALEGASLVYSGLGHFEAIGCVLGAPTVTFLAIARMGLADSLTVSVVTVAGAEGAISVGRSSVMPSSKGLPGGDLVGGRGDGGLVSGGFVDNESSRSVMDTSSGGGQMQSTIGLLCPLLPPPQGSFPRPGKAPTVASLQLLSYLPQGGPSLFVT